MVHQTGLADTAVAEDDDLIVSSVFPVPFLRFRLRTFNKIFLREAILVLLIVEVAVVAEVGDLAVRRYGWRAVGDFDAGRVEKWVVQKCD